MAYTDVPTHHESQYVKYLEQENQMLKKKLASIKKVDVDSLAGDTDRADSVASGSGSPHGSASLNSQYTILGKYQLRQEVGKGSFGTVNVVVDNTKKRYALKTVIQDDEHRNREQEICNFFMKHTNEHVVRIHYTWLESNKLFILMDFVKSSLYSVLYGLRDRDLHMHRGVFTTMMHQLASGMAFLHSHNIAHRDLKPENVLVNTKTKHVYICDFGCAKCIDSDNQTKPHNTYICSRFYRAPELIVDRNLYTVAIDVWSYACIFIECCIGKVLFMESDNVSMLIQQMKLLGNLELSDLHRMKTTISYSDGFPNIRELTSNWPMIHKIRHFGNEYKDLCTKMLTFNVERRIKANEITQHPFFCKSIETSFNFPKITKAD